MESRELANVIGAVYLYPYGVLWVIFAVGTALSSFLGEVRLFDSPVDRVIPIHIRQLAAADMRRASRPPRFVRL